MFQTECGMDQILSMRGSFEENRICYLSKFKPTPYYLDIFYGHSRFRVEIRVRISVGFGWGKILRGKNPIKLQKFAKFMTELS